MSSFSANGGSTEVFPSCDKVKSWGVEFECTTETASLAKLLAIKSQYFDKSQYKNIVIINSNNITNKTNFLQQ